MKLTADMFDFEEYEYHIEWVGTLKLEAAKVLAAEVVKLDEAQE